MHATSVYRATRHHSKYYGTADAATENGGSWMALDSSAVDSPRAGDWSRTLPGGVLNIMVTPFTDAETVDVSSLRRLTRWTVESGVDGLIPLGIMGEAHKLIDSERDVVLRTVVEEAGGVPVVAGCTAESTVAVLHRIERAADLGASTVMVAPPRAATTPSMQIEHYSALARAGALPVVIQDEPITTGVVMTSATLGQLCELDGVAGVKVEQAPSPTKISGILAAAADAACYGGLGGLYLLEELQRGAAGVMTGFAFPEVLVATYRRFADGDLEGAWAIFHHWMPLIRYEAQLGVGGVAIRKQLLTERGVIASPTARRPVPPGDPQSLDELRDLLVRLSAGNPLVELGTRV